MLLRAFPKSSSYFGLPVRGRRGGPLLGSSVKNVLVTPVKVPWRATTVIRELEHMT